MGLFYSTTSDLPHINIREARKVAPITDPHQSHIRLTIGEPYNNTVDVPIAASLPNYGGFRSWFACPSCDRHTTDLYLHNGQLACRKCWHLSYDTQFYRKDTLCGGMLALHKAALIEKSGRRLWYGGQPTRTGRRYLRYADTMFSTAPLNR
jgi:hypothetical protein